MPISTIRLCGGFIVVAIYSGVSTKTSGYKLVRSALRRDCGAVMEPCKTLRSNESRQHDEIALCLLCDSHVAVLWYACDIHSILCDYYTSVAQKPLIFANTFLNR